MSRALDVVTLTGAEYDALTQRADDWYALYAEEAKKRAKLRDALEPFAAIDLLECRLPPEFAMHVLRARGALTPNAIGQGSAACGASPAPTGCASNGKSE
jgi:hypothetical protein